jgi:putative ABC transport system permease protein
LLRAGDTGKVVLGSSFTDDSFGRSITVGRHVTLQGTDFEVVGILKPAGSFQINQAILMSERDLKQLLDLDDEFDLIVARVQNKNEVEIVAKSIEEKLRRDRNEKPDEEDFTVQTPIQALSTINTVLTVINVIVVGIAFISLIVGGVGIMNTMYTSVLERTKEIGVMKAVGARNADILIIFLIESGLLGMLGGTIGVLLGWGISELISLIANSILGTDLLQAAAPWYLFVGCLAFAFVVGAVSGVLPAWQASKVRPVKALRYE